MDKFTSYLEELLIFMANDIEQKASSLQNTFFYFDFLDTKQQFHTTEGEDLQKFKQISNLKDDELIKEILLEALDENYIQRSYLNGRSFDNIVLTPKGFQKAILIKKP